MSDLLSMSW